MRPGIISYFMAHDDRPRGERRREAMRIYRSYKSPNGTRSKSLGETRAMRRTKANSKPSTTQSKYQNKRVSFAKYLKGWLFDSGDMYYTHVPKQLRKGKSVTEIQKLRAKQFKVDRKHRAALGWN